MCLFFGHYRLFLSIVHFYLPSMFPLLRSSYDKVRPHPKLPSFILGNKKSDRRRRGSTQGEQGGNKEVRGGTQKVGGVGVKGRRMREGRLQYFGLLLFSVLALRCLFVPHCSMTGASTDAGAALCVCACVSVCERERGGGRHAGRVFV